MKAINIVSITIDDITTLQTIGKKTFSEAFGDDNNQSDLHKYLDEKFSTTQLSKELENPHSKFYFAKLEEAVVGYLKVNFLNAQSEPNHESAMEIERIYVLQPYYGKKVGLALFNKALAIAKEKGVPYIWLGVWENNARAIRFYEKNGFKAFDTHTFVLGDDPQTDILMKLELAQ